MSNWTHVAAVFRVDDLATLSKKTRSNPDKVFGKECLLNGIDDDSIKAFSKEYKNAMKHPEKYLPMGSEGSLHKSVWENPDPSELAHYTITVWGDLRDHESIDEIETWFRGCCEKLKGWIRQACCTIVNDFNGARNIMYRFDEEVKE